MRDPKILPDVITQVQCSVSRCAFYGNRSGPSQACNIVRRCFTAQMHQNAPCDPQIPPDVKTQVSRDLSRGAFYGNRIRPTRAGKIVHLCFSRQMHRNALHDPHIHGIQKHKFSVTCPNVLFMDTASGPPDYEK
jgi:hypothetical protein